MIQKDMQNKFLLCVLFFASTLFCLAQKKTVTDSTELRKNRIYQWEADIESIVAQNKDNPRRGFLWIPPQCQQLKGIILCGHNQLEEGIVEDPLFRQSMTNLNFGIIWITPGIDPSGVYDVRRGAQKAFEEVIQKLADISGYEELLYAPVVCISHSAQASQPWNFGAWNSERTLAMISFHGDSPRSNYLCCNHFNPNWEDRNIDGIPGLICIGEHEWSENRITDSFVFMRQYPGSLISLLCNAGRGHSDFSQDDLKCLIRFIEKSVEYRMPTEWDGQSIMPLKKMKREEGWLADRWRKNTLPTAPTNTWKGYCGDKDSAYWYFDEEMARWTEGIYTRERNKKKQYMALMQNNRILKPDESLLFVADGCNMDVHVRIVFTDSTYTYLSDKHTIEPIMIKRYAGPVSIINDTTFRLDHYRPGVSHNRAMTIGLFAFSESDMHYGHVVRNVLWKIPSSLNEGKIQEIKFPIIKDVESESQFISLKAKSNCNLPIKYYVRSGPAYIENNTLVFTDLPPRSKYPVKITVVAWQYGSAIEPKIKTAIPVERSFYLYR